MRTVFIAPICVLSVCSLLVACSPAAQEREASEAKGFAPPKTAWGHPDIQGTYTTNEVNGVPVERPAEQGTKRELTEEEFAKWKVESEQQMRKLERSGTGNGPQHWYEWWNRESRRTSLVVDPPNGQIPWRPDAPRGTGGSFGRGAVPASWLDLHSWDRCMTRGLPSVMAPEAYNAGLQILQTPDSVMILYEMVHDARIIPLDGSPHISDKIGQWMGDSRGRWEGNTLVVDVTNFGDKADNTLKSMGSYMGGGKTMHLVERFTPVSANRIEYEATVEDPAKYLKPWTVAIPMVRDDNYRIFEYACHEGNYAIKNILSGARAKEAGGRGGDEGGEP
jgi:hypothetical protein